jgi:drug/metabolite transporter (DMT)-like permease
MSPLFVLILAVLAVTYAAPVIRFASAPALAIAFWRLALVLPVTLALAWREHADAGRAEPRPRGDRPLIVLAGVLLAAHFWTWIASLQFTTVASSVLLVSLKPLFVWAIAALWLGEHPGRRERWGIALAVAGATLIGIGDARLSAGALAGDLLALAGAITVAGYYVIGRRVRQRVPVWRYVTPVYATAAVVLGFFALVTRVPLVGFGARDWAVFGALALGPMLVGHTGMNYALRHFRATTVNVAGLVEPVGATIIAWLLPAIHEIPSRTAIAGGALVLAGIVLALGDRRAAAAVGEEGTALGAG